MKYKALLAIILLLGVFCLNSCEEKDETKPQTDQNDDTDGNGSSSINNDIINEFIYAVVKEQAWYFWYKNVPNIQPANQEPYEYLESLLYQDLDRWSFVTDYDTYKAVFIEGKYIGFGFAYQVDMNNDLRVSFVYEDSPMYDAGITRGYKIIEINGTPVQTLLDNDSIYYAFGEDEIGKTVDFTFESLDGSIIQKTFAKKEIQQNTVLHHSVIDLENQKAGYVVFESFIDISIDELDNAFATFKDEGITKLILDLRYNGGGSTEVAQHLGSLIAGKTAKGEVFQRLMFNDQHTEENGKDENISRFTEENYTLDIDTLVVIATKSTASASEAVINGIQPFIDVVIVGEDTYGKPVGMSGFVEQMTSTVLFPVTFKIVNSENEGGYYDGLPADAYVNDDLTHPFGDLDEACLNQAVYFLNNGTFDDQIIAKKAYTKIDQVELRGLRAIIGAF